MIKPFYSFSFLMLFLISLGLQVCAENERSIIGVYPEGEVVQKENRWVGIYESNVIVPQSNKSRICIEALQLKNWDLRWSITVSGKKSQPTSLDTDHDLPQSAFQLRCEVAYRGTLSLTKKQWLECRPEVLLVPSVDCTVKVKDLAPPWYKRLFGYHAPKRAGTILGSTPQNILILMIDTLRSDHLPSYGHPFVIAPHADMLASLGVLFQQSYGASSSTRPSCGSIFSGLQPKAHGAVRHATEGAYLYDGVPLLAETFAANQFNTAAVSSNAQITSVYGFDRGFDIFHCPVWENQVTPGGLDYLQTVDEPFFLYLHYLAPHQPYDPPAILQSIYNGQHEHPEQDFYCGEITLDDRRIGSVLKEMAQQGLLDRTLIWLLSDHGEEFWEHGWNGHGAKLYEESVRTVSIISYPVAIPGGRVIEEPVTHVDILPTMVDLYGWDVPMYGQGVSLLPSIKGEVNAALTGRPLFLHHGGGIQKGPHESDKDGVLLEKNKLIWWNQKQEWEFYDLVDDPAEMDNRFNAEEEIQMALQALMKKHLNSCETIAKEYKLPIGNSDRRSLSAEELENMKALGYIKDE